MLSLKIMKQNGNLKSNDLYNPDEFRHPPPTNMMDLERDSDLERYIRGSDIVFSSVRHF
jgi:stromal membrane-associated protein